MDKRIHRNLIAAAFAVIAGHAAAGDVYVVTGTSTPLAAADIHDVYSGEKQFAGNVKLVVLDNAAAQPDFLAKALKMEAGRYASMWSKKSFRDGLTQPALKSGDAEILAAIKANPATVGYVSKPAPDVKVVEKY